MPNNNRLPVSLLLLRAGVFVVMFVWTLDKFIRPEHAGEVFKNYYYISEVSSTALYVVAAIEMLIIIGFLIGFQKKWTYGAVLILHGLSTIASYKQYFAPFEGMNIFFFAAWPMLAASYALFVLRDRDTMWTVEK